MLAQKVGHKSRVRHELKEKKERGGKTMIVQKDKQRILGFLLLLKIEGFSVISYGRSHQGIDSLESG